MPPEKAPEQKEEPQAEEGKKQMSGFNKSGRTMNTPGEIEENTKKIKEDDNWYREQQ